MEVELKPAGAGVSSRAASGGFMLKDGSAPESLVERRGRSPAPTPRDISRRIAEYAQPSTFKGLLSFAIDIAGYMAMIAVVLFVDSLVAKIAASILAGVFMLNLGSLAHEAAHGSLVRTKAGNKSLAVICFTILMFNYRLWVYEHHALHHKHTNVKDLNSWSPLSPAEYHAKSWLGRAMYRLYRSETGLGILVYYLIERWVGGHVYPGKWLPKQFHASAWRYFALMMGWAAAFVTFLYFAPTYSSTSSFTAITLGFVVPLLQWITSFSLSVCMQHVSPTVPWYADRRSGAQQGVEERTVHITLPKWIGHFTHYAMDHPVHHINGKVPHYRLSAAQEELTRMTGERVTSAPYTPKVIHDTFKRCKLYDYERHVWTDFDGNVTGVPLLKNEREHAPA
jgi:acyl-lipid omega-6 desaturase (Delta-12 desaturase)